MTETAAFSIDALANGAEELGLSLSPDQLNGLVQYAEMLLKWNRVYNLTAIRDPADVLSHHLLDSLAAVLPLRRQLAAMGLSSARILDVGSGTGVNFQHFSKHALVTALEPNTKMIQYAKSKKTKILTLKKGILNKSVMTKISNKGR